MKRNRTAAKTRLIVAWYAAIVTVAGTLPYPCAVATASHVRQHIATTEEVSSVYLLHAAGELLSLQRWAQQKSPPRETTSRQEPSEEDGRGRPPFFSMAS
jgi:hypothetical protein|eukprot:COSAG01_NODE_5545_length_4192_cov_2.721231_2_plen_100_part_00